MGQYLEILRKRSGKKDGSMLLPDDNFKKLIESDSNIHPRLPKRLDTPRRKHELRFLNVAANATTYVKKELSKRCIRMETVRDSSL